MQFVPSSPFVLLAVAVLMLRWRREGAVWLLAMAPFGMTAAFNLPAVGGTTIIAIDLAVLGLLFVVVLSPGGLSRALGTFSPQGPGFALLCYMAVAVVATLFLPRVFADAMEVFSIGRVEGQVGIVSRPLRPGGGNLSQLMRMMLSVLAFVAMAAYAWGRPDAATALRAVKVATALHVGLGLADIATNAANVEWLMSLVRTANYSLTLGQRMAGLNRMIGGFPEASAYGYLSLGLFGFWVSYFVRTKGDGARAGLWLAAITFVLLRGTSSSAYVGAGLFLALFALAGLAGLRGNRFGTRTVMILVSGAAALPVLAAGAYLLYALVPAVTDFVDRSLLDKLSTDSGVERMSWNVQAWSNFLDSYGLGAGLGSVRASNWVIAVLATTGVLGAAFYLAFIYGVMRLPHHRLPADAAAVVVSLKFACLAFLMRAVVTKATPNLEIAFFACAGLATGLCFALARAPRTTDETPAFASVRRPVAAPVLDLAQRPDGPRPMSGLRPIDPNPRA